MSERVLTLAGPALGLFFSVVVSRSLGPAHAWALLIAGAAWARLSIVVGSPSLAIAAPAVILVLGGISLRSQKKVVAPRSALELVTLAMILWLWVRSCFPHFDVDSLSYHLAAPEWLKWTTGRTESGATLARWVDVRYLWIGFEDWWAIAAPYPAHAALYAGAWGGVFKALSVLSLTTPFPSAVLRPWIAALCLLDDHFAFSGVSRWVYINPALIGTLALCAHFGFRVWRGKLGAAAPMLGMAAAAASVKYHGLYAIAFAGVLLVVTSARRRRLPSLRGRDAWWIIPCVGLLLLYGTNWIWTGSPTYPFSLGPLQLFFPYTGDRLADNASLAPWRLIGTYGLWVMIRPGCLALKISAVLLGPITLLALTRTHLPGSLRRYLRGRSTRTAAYFIFCAALWAIAAASIQLNDFLCCGRFARYGLGLAALGVGYSVLSARIPPGLVRTIRVSQISAIAGITVLVAILATWDTRAFNISPLERPGWSQWVSYWSQPDQREPGQEVRSVADPAAVACLGCQSQMPRRGLVAVDSSEINWPAFWIAPHAIRLDRVAAGWVGGPKPEPGTTPSALTCGSSAKLYEY